MPNAPHPYPSIHAGAAETICGLLGRERLMSIAVNRPDGWPQVTTVGYINDGLTLYFVTGRASQKLANIQADPRVSIAIHAGSDRVGAVGVTMAARGVEITDPAEIERLNRIMFERWPSVSVYCPASSSVAVVQVKPELICAINAASGRSQTQCFSVGDADRAPSPAAMGGRGPGAISAEARQS